MRLLRFIVVCLLVVSLPARAMCALGVGCHDEPRRAALQWNDSPPHEPVRAAPADTHADTHANTHGTGLHALMHAWGVHAPHDLNGHEPSPLLDAEQTQRVCASLCTAAALHRTPTRTSEPMLLARLPQAEQPALFDDAALALPKRPPRTI